MYYYITIIFTYYNRGGKYDPKRKRQTKAWGA